MKFIEFIKSKVFWWQIVIAIIVTIALISIVMWSLSFYTQQGETVEVPNLQGYKVEQIEKLMGNTTLEFVVMDSIFRQGAEPGAIVEQSPQAGKRVKNGRKIFLTINAYGKEMALMPQLVDYSLRNAKVVIESSGLKLGEVTYQPSEFQGLVLAQLVDGRQIKPGTKIPKGTTISIIVGSGASNNSVVIPDLIGLAYEDAIKVIKESTFNVGSVIYDKTITTIADSMSAAVYHQSPEAINGATELAGSSINIWLTTDMDLVTSAAIGNVDEE